MKLVKDVLICLLLIAGSGFFISLVLFVRDADKTVKAVPAEIAATRSALTAEIDTSRQDLLATVQHDLLGTLDARLASSQKTADHRLASMQHMVDARTKQALQMADSRLADVTAQVAAVQSDLHPVLANAASVEKDAQDSWDDLYFDVKAGVESATVAATSIAQTSETVRNAAPQVAASVQGIAKSADGVAADVKREADAVTAPKKWWQKILGPVYTIGRLAAAFL
jgi:hypothetical protein